MSESNQDDREDDDVEMRKLSVLVNTQLVHYQENDMCQRDRYQRGTSCKLIPGLPKYGEQMPKEGHSDTSEQIWNRGDVACGRVREPIILLQEFTQIRVK